MCVCVCVMNDEYNHNKCVTCVLRVCVGTSLGRPQCSEGE